MLAEEVVHSLLVYFTFLASLPFIKLISVLNSYQLLLRRAAPILISDREKPKATHTPFRAQGYAERDERQGSSWFINLFLGLRECQWCFE
jgi:hypothetical protein